MTSRCSQSTLALLGGFLLFLPGCHRDTGAKPSGPQYIMLTFNGGACQQNGSYGVVDVYQNQAVVYQGAAALGEFQVRFTACPFASCPVNSPHGTSVNVGPPNAGTTGTTFNYSGITIDDQPCKDVEAMGVHIKPGR